jgi:Uma2 family endonuclease
MSLVQTLPEIEYPESDGRPMGETDLHRLWMSRIYDLLSYRYRDQRVYVGCDLLVYYVQNKPKKYVVPDDFVVLDCEPGLRRTFKIWVEHRIPNAVFEVTSLKTWRDDQQKKPEKYAAIGVKELFLYDPTQDYLDPPLQGYRLWRGQYRPIRPDASGALQSRELGIILQLEQSRLVMFDAKTGERLLTEAEAERAAREAEHAAREAERAAREAAEARADEESRARQALEEELRCLRERQNKTP